jgi:hypothetical protein
MISHYQEIELALQSFGEYAFDDPTAANHQRHIREPLPSQDSPYPVLQENARAEWRGGDGVR